MGELSSTVMVGAGPVAPMSPLTPALPVGPVGPWGSTKSSATPVSEGVAVTAAVEPEVTFRTVTDGVVPVGPVTPWLP